MKSLNELKVERMTKDLRTPVVVIGGVIVGNYGTNTIIPSLIDKSGVQGVLGAEMTDNAKTFIKIALPIGVGLAGYQLFDNKDAKNLSIGIAGSGLLNGANLLIRKNLPQLAQRALTVAGLGDSEAPQSSSELNTMLNTLDYQLSQMSGTQALPQNTSGYIIEDEDDEEDFEGIDFDDDDDDEENEDFGEIEFEKEEDLTNYQEVGLVM